MGEALVLDQPMAQEDVLEHTQSTVNEFVIAGGLGEGIAFPPSEILTTDETRARGLRAGSVIADIEIGEHPFAARKTISLVEANVTRPFQPEVSDKRVLLLGMEVVDGQKRYIRSQLVDITDRLGAGDVVIDDTDSATLGIKSFSENTANSLVFARVKGIPGYVVEQVGGHELYCKVRANIPNYEPDRNLEEVAAEREPVFDYTVQADRVAELLPEIGRPQIGRDRRIDGGVYMVARDNQTDQILGEVITVDDKYDKPYIDAYITEALQRAGKESTDNIVKARAAFEVIKERMHYSQKTVDKVLDGIVTNRQLESIDGTKVSLAYFMHHGVGVCRHQAIALGRVLEAMTDQQLLQGEISVDRNMTWNPKHEKYDGHAWVRYVAPDREIYILDVAQGYFGTLRDSKAFAQWNYYRPGETEQELAV